MSKILQDQMTRPKKVLVLVRLRIRDLIMISLKNSKM